MGGKEIWSPPLNKNPRLLPLTLIECWYTSHSVLLFMNCAVLWHVKASVKKLNYMPTFI